MIEIIRYPVIGLLALTVLAGCSNKPGEETQPPPAALPAAPLVSTYIRLAPAGPPPVKEEFPPKLDDPRGDIWRPGYWSYDNGQFSWVPGAIMAKPDFTAVWMPDHWEKRSYGWAFVAGFWQ